VKAACCPKNGRQTPVIFLSAQDIEKDTDAAPEIGVDYILKNIFKQDK